MQKKADQIEQWDRYWSYGNIHSFSQVCAGNYQGRVAGFWRDRFEHLDRHGRVLDLATGNGAIALLALETADRLCRPLEVHGVDLADIQPAERVGDPALRESLSRIQFRGRVAAESLPFENGYFDMVCSQFGVEYSDLSRSVPEIARVTKSGGRLSAIIHHRDSALLEAARDEITQLDFVLNDVKLYLRARNLLRELSDEKRGGKAAGRMPPKLEKKYRALQDAMKRISQAAETSASPNMLLGPARYVHEIVGALDRKSPRELLGWLDEARRRVTANQRRLLDMTQAAKRETDLQDMRECLMNTGFRRVELALFYREDGAILGWRVDGAK